MLMAGCALCMPNANSKCYVCSMFSINNVRIEHQMKIKRKINFKQNNTKSIYSQLADIKKTQSISKVDLHDLCKIWMKGRTQKI